MTTGRRLHLAFVASIRSKPFLIVPIPDIYELSVLFKMAALQRDVAATVPNRKYVQLSMKVEFYLRPPVKRAKTMGFKTCALVYSDEWHACQK